MLLALLLALCTQDRKNRRKAWIIPFGRQMACNGNETFLERAPNFIRKLRLRVRASRRIGPLVNAVFVGIHKTAQPLRDDARLNRRYGTRTEVLSPRKRD